VNKRFKILRFDPTKDQGPRFQVFHHTPKPKDSVLEALKDIRDQQDPSLAFRYSCREAVCGSCAMVINGAISLACRTQVESFGEGEVVIEPRTRLLKPFVSTDALQPSVAQRRFKVLVVDDQPESLMLIVRALVDGPYDVSTATSGPEGLRMIAEAPPDLVVLDYKMTGMDGPTVVKTLRARAETASLPVLMLTAMTDEASTRAGFEAGVTDYVTKPFSIPQLVARVHACLARTGRR